MLYTMCYDHVLYLNTFYLLKLCTYLFVLNDTGLTKTSLLKDRVNFDSFQSTDIRLVEPKVKPIM